MIVQYASDLHLDYGQNYEYVLNKGFEEEGNVLILAGDVANLVALRTYRLFWDLCSSNFEKRSSYRAITITTANGTRSKT